MTDPSDADLARRALPLLDLTDLSDTATAAGVDTLLAKALARPVAAICIWPRFVARAAPSLAGTGIQLATVVNFPSGEQARDAVVAETVRAVADGATEIDVVLPYRAFLEGDAPGARALLDAVRDACRGSCLKVILETGELPTLEAITEASECAIAHGADFIKTSTGKTRVSATPDAARAMLAAIRASGRPVGLKVSGGIRTVADARAYLDLADDIMGPGWVSPASFRIGASALYDALAEAGA